MAVPNSPSSPLSRDESSSPSKLESSESLASIAQNLQRTVLQSSPIRAARSLGHNSSTHIRSLQTVSQDIFPEVISQYRTYEDAFINKVKEGLMVAREQPTIVIGFALAATLVMRAPRRFLFRHTLGRLQSEEYASAEKNVRDLNLSVDLMRKESKKLLERTALAEKDMRYGHNELVSSGAQIQHLAKSIYKVEAKAADLTDGLRHIPSREALALRAEVASLASILKRQRLVLHRRTMKISELGVPV
ncbi:RGS1-HXK1-interacting protein 1 isoform X2 [Neltuma alba]|uniref:RGS1-HXK1-interacting protein 1 isoform X2 n=1 Tax=Neltuma alba TaxID=207710 RepID=UPI0010A50E8B|nr:RGS1-HXK1-interacting protein 1 isoform X2 [Prosopis alba]